jgi:hypothetical protein
VKIFHDENKRKKWLQWLKENSSLVVLLGNVDFLESLQLD